MDAGEALVGAQSGGGLERGLTVAEAHSEGQEPGWCCECRSAGAGRLDRCEQAEPWGVAQGDGAFLQGVRACLPLDGAHCRTFQRPDHLGSGEKVHGQR